MNPITLPKRPDLADIVPLSSSPDGQLNSFCMRCDSQEQTMQYSACLWRQAVLNKPDIRTPSDWAPCSEAARHGTCVALMMRKEEEAAEQSIYFRKRHNENHPMAEAKRSWHSSALDTVKKTVAAAATSVAGIARMLDTPKPAAAPARPRDAIDALGSAGGYAEAINAMVASGAHTTPPPAPVSTPAPPISTLGSAMPGESPLAMARRLAAARAAAIAAK
jgi:hypothetical protein